VVGAGIQRELSCAPSFAKPRGLNMGYIVEHEPRGGDDPRIEAWQFRVGHALAQRRRARFETPWNEGVEASGFVLKVAKPHQVLDDILGPFTMPIRHRRARL